MDEKETEKLKEELRQKLENIEESENITEPETTDDEYKSGYVDDEEDFEEIVIESEEEIKKKQFRKKLLNILYDVLIVVGIGLVLYGGYSFYKSYKDSQESGKSYENLESEFVVQTPNDSKSTEGEGTEEPRPKEWYEMIWVDLEGLQTKVNEDIKGWIFFENEDISYPILYSGDNSEYNRVRYDKEPAIGGSIILDENNSPDFADIRNILYGHDMRDLSMFGKLEYYRKQDGYYQDHQYFQIMYDGMVYRYQIFSYFECHEEEMHLINVNYNIFAPYGELLEELVERSLIDTGVPVTDQNKTMTLLTCTDDKEKRFLVNAVLVDQHVMLNEDGNYPVEPDTEGGTEEPGTEGGTEGEVGTEPGTENQDPNNDEPTYTYTEMYKIMWATTGVKIRNQPSTDGVRLGYIAKDQPVEVIAQCNENGWYRVKYYYGTGYVSGSYLTDIGPTIVPDTTVPDTTVPDTPVPDTPAPDTTVPDTTVPDTTVPDTQEPSTQEPDTGTETPGIEEPTEPEIPPESEDPMEPESSETQLPEPEEPGTEVVPSTEESVVAEPIETV